jgi:hypothetical protein
MYVIPVCEPYIKLWMIKEIIEGEHGRSSSWGLARRWATGIYGSWPMDTVAWNAVSWALGVWAGLQGAGRG